MIAAIHTSLGYIFKSSFASTYNSAWTEVALDAFRCIVQNITLLNIGFSLISVSAEVRSFIR